MKFDNIIIGGGLSGLICGIRLQKQGQKCVIVSAGQSALHFSSGSLDLLNTLPDGTDVKKPLDAIDSLIEQAPSHPYAKLGKEKFSQLATEAESFLKEIGVEVSGCVKENHYRITPLGTTKSTWLSFSGLATSPEGDKLPWKRVAIFNIEGFLDFYPRFVADEFKNLGTESDIHTFTLPDIDRLRLNPSELRAANIAKALDKPENIEALAQILKEKVGDCDAIVLPACMELTDQDSSRKLEQKVGKPIYMLPTMPPSIVGIHTQTYLRKYFQQLGGVYMLGDNVIKMEMEGDKVARIYSYNHSDVPFIGKNFILATGSYFSQGLIALQDKVYEPIFNLDVEYLKNRDEWYDKNSFNKQQYQQFGVKTNNNFQGLREGKAIENLYVAGAILEGFNPIKEGTGGGVSILTSLSVADNILSK